MSNPNLPYTPEPDLNQDPQMSPEVRELLEQYQAGIVDSDGRVINRQQGTTPLDDIVARVLSGE